MSIKEKNNWNKNRMCWWKGDNFKEGLHRSPYGEAHSNEKETPAKVCEQDHVDI